MVHERRGNRREAGPILKPAPRVHGVPPSRSRALLERVHQLQRQAASRASLDASRHARPAFLGHELDARPAGAGLALLALGRGGHARAARRPYSSSPAACVRERRRHALRILGGQAGRALGGSRARRRGADPAQHECPPPSPPAPRGARGARRGVGGGDRRQAAHRLLPRGHVSGVRDRPARSRDAAARVRVDRAARRAGRHDPRCGAHTRADGAHPRRAQRRHL